MPPSLLGGRKRRFAAGESACVRAGYMTSVRNKPPNVGDKLRRYEKMDVALHLMCNITSDITKRYIKLQHEDQLRVDL